MSILDSTDELNSPQPDLQESQEVTGEVLTSLSDDDKGLLSSTIMMVDDESINTEVIQMFLEDAGYHQFVTTDISTEAISLMKKNHPDILLLDLQMPAMSGFEIMSTMATDSELKHIPVLILTSATDPDIKLKALEMGATDFLAKPVDPSELVLRMKNTLAAKAYQDQLAYFDSVSGLPNADMFNNRVSLLIDQVEQDECQFSVLQIELERYQDVVDVYGAETGNSLIRLSGKSIEKTLREVETSGQSIFEDSWRNIARISNNRIAIAIAFNGDTTVAEFLARQLRNILEKPYLINEQEIFSSPRIGIAFYPQDGKSQEELVNNSSNALKNASHESGDNIHFYSAKLNSQARENLALESDLRKALELSQLQVYYQPKVDLVNGGIKGAEALLRWFHPEHGLISPVRFIPIAEETGLIVSIGEWVLREACRQTKEWIIKGYESFNISINLSAKQFQGTDLKEIVQAALWDNDLNGKNVTLELTESLVMHNPEETTKRLYQIKDLGVDLSIDDFGTGYSSLSYLKKFPLDELKIDYSFMKGLHKDPDDAAIVSAIIALSHSMNLRVVGEGVELEEQKEILIEKGCEIMQGFLCSKPVSADEFLKLLESNS